MAKLLPACGCSPAGPCPIAAILFRGRRWRMSLRLHLTYALERAEALARGDLRFHPVRRPKHFHVYQPGEVCRGAHASDFRANQKAKLRRDPLPVPRPRPK